MCSKLAESFIVGGYLCKGSLIVCIPKVQVSLQEGLLNLMDPDNNGETIR